MVSLRCPLWILFDLEGNPLMFPKGTINILFKFASILKGIPFKFSQCTIRILFELSSNWRDSLQFPKGVLKFLIKFFSILGKSDMHSNDILKISSQIVFNFLRLLMVSLRLPLWILIDLEGKPFIYSKRTISILFGFGEKAIYFYKYELFRKPIKPKPHV